MFIELWKDYILVSRFTSEKDLRKYAVNDLRLKLDQLAQAGYIVRKVESIKPKRRR